MKNFYRLAIGVTWLLLVSVANAALFTGTVTSLDVGNIQPAAPPAEQGAIFMFTLASAPSECSGGFTFSYSDTSASATESAKAFYSTLLLAQASGSSVTVNYATSVPTVCDVTAVTLN